MIVTCPSCDTSFAVDESLLGERGRKVRCSECGHRWHQLPEPAETPDAAPAESAEEETAASGTPEVQDTPEAPEPSEPAAPPADPPEPAPKPEPELEEAPASPPPVRGPKLFEDGDEDVLDDGERRFAVLGWSIFFVVLALIAGGFYFGQSHIVAFEPRFQKLYDLVGMKAHEESEPVAAVPGEGLSLPAEKLLKSRKRVNGQPMIVVEGIVVNETNLDQPVPTLRATVANAEAEVLARWYFEADAAQIGPDDEVAFATSIADSWGRQGIGISIIFVSEETARNEPSILP